MLKKSVLLIGTLAALSISSYSQAAPIYKIDIDSTNGGSPISTEAGWTSLNVGAGAGNGSSVTVSGVTFEVFSADDSRVRSAGTNDLTKDFVFDDGADQAVGLKIFGLADGMWEASVYSWDTFAIDPQIVGITEFGAAAESIYTSGFAGSAITPFKFTFDSSTLMDGFGIFTRENNGADRARFNALELSYVPVPATVALFALGLAGIGFASRKKG